MKVTRVAPTLTYQHLYKIHHAYTVFPAWNMHPSTQHTLHLATQLLTSPRPVCHHLTFTSDSSESDQNPDSTPELSDEEEDFQTVPIDNEHWTTEMVPERPFCIHENGIPNNVCQYPCPYGNNNTASYMDSLDLSNISNYKDYMMTTSDDKELPGLEEVPYWHFFWTLVCLNTYLTFNYTKLCTNLHITALP